MRVVNRGIVGKNMKEVTVPDAAEAILNDVIKQIEAILSDGEEESVDDSAPEDIDDYPGQKHFRLVDSLNLLPHRWCAMDPLVYDCYLHGDRANCCLVFARREEAPHSVGTGVSVPVFSVWPNDTEIPQTLYRHYVPHELRNILHLWIGGSHLHIQFLTDVNLTLMLGDFESLRNKVMVRNEGKSARNSASLQPVTDGQLSPSTKRSTLLTVPQNALSILDEIIEIAAYALECYPEDADLWDVLLEGDHGSPHEMIFKLAYELMLAAYRWCGIDPLLFDCYVYPYDLVFARREEAPEPFGGSGSPHLLLWPNKTPIPSHLARHSVPEEIALLLYGSINTDDRKMGFWEKTFVESIKADLEYLRRLVEIHEESTTSISSSAKRDVGRSDLVSLSQCVPEDATHILNEIITQCDKIIAIESTPDAMAEPSGNTPESEEQIERLFELLNHVGLKWCKRNPFQYDYCCMEQGQEFVLVFFGRATRLHPRTKLEVRTLPKWHRTGPVPEDALSMLIPMELGIVIHDYENGPGGWSTDRTAFVKESLLSLRMKVEVLLSVEGTDSQSDSGTKLADRSPEPTPVGVECQETGNSQQDRSEPPIDGFYASKGYRSVRLRGATYPLTQMQAAVIRLLHEEHKNGTPDVGLSTLVEVATGSLESSHKSLRDIFRNKDAREKLIRNGGSKGTYRLNI